MTTTFITEKATMNTVASSIPMVHVHRVVVSRRVSTSSRITWENMGITTTRPNEARDSAITFASGLPNCFSSPYSSALMSDPFASSGFALSPDTAAARGLARSCTTAEALFTSRSCLSQTWSNSAADIATTPDTGSST